MPASPYTDLDRPPLDPRRLRRALVAPAGPWARLELHVETGSTNADAAEAARAGEPEGLVVVAERQTAGRGRRGRIWESPPRAGIATSVLLRPGVADPTRGWPPAPPAGYGWLPLLAGVALVRTVTRLAELEREVRELRRAIGTVLRKVARIVAEDGTPPRTVTPMIRPASAGPADLPVPMAQIGS